MLISVPVPRFSGAMNQPKISPKPTMAAVITSSEERRPKRSASQPETGTMPAKSRTAISWITRNER